MAATILRRVAHRSLQLRIYNYSKPNGAVLNTTTSCRSFFASHSLFSERKFTEKHEWIMMNGNIGVIGITNYAQEALGDVVFAQLPDIGAEFNAMDECGALESVKAASEIYCPLSGKVTEKNVAVEDKPVLINKSCYDQGWLFSIQLTKPEELDSLMTEEEYNKFLKDQTD